MYELFKAGDLNGDGQISQDEWVTAINENKLFKVEVPPRACHGYRHAPPAAAASVPLPPTRRPCSSACRVTDAQLCKYFGSSSEDEIRNAFSRIDADGNGFISWDEFVSASSYGLA